MLCRWVYDDDEDAGTCVVYRAGGVWHVNEERGDVL
jgi:hypothetical protein